MILRAIHRTSYCYGSNATRSHNEVRLMPLNDDDQSCLQFDLRIDPATKVFHYDEPGGRVHHFAVRDPHRALEIVAEALVETHVSNPFQGLNLVDGDWGQLPIAAREHPEFMVPTQFVPYLNEVAEVDSRLGRQATVAGTMIQLSRHIHEWLDYDPDATSVYSTLSEVLAKRAGVCQDFAHLMLACARQIGVPSRYVSGYLFVRGAQGMRGDQATHAWVECLMPDGRWLGLDPTNNMVVNDRYIKVHIGRDYSDVSPTRGVYHGPPATELKVSVSIVAEPLMAATG